MEEPGYGVRFTRHEPYVLTAKLKYCHRLALMLALNVVGTAPITTPKTSTSASGEEMAYGW